MVRPRILVTGAGGFIGRQVLGHLASAGELHCVSRAPRTDTNSVAWHSADLLDATACAKLLATVRPSHLAHLAWNTRHGQFWTAPDNALWCDTGAALVRAFAEAGGQRLLICGTGAEYAATAPSPLDERSSSLQAETIYGQAKNTFREAAQQIAAEFGLSFVWPRIFNIYGPHEDVRRLVPSIIVAILRAVPAECSSGGQRRDFMDVRDLGRALAALLLRDIEGPINLGSGHAATIAQVAQTIGRLMNRPKLIDLGALPDRPGEPLVQVPALTRMHKDLRFVPQHTLEQGLRHAITWWQEHADTIGNSTHLAR